MKTEPIRPSGGLYPHMTRQTISYPSEHKCALIDAVRKYFLGAELSVKGQDYVLAEFPWGRALLWLDTEPLIHIRYEATEFKYLKQIQQTVEQAMAAFRIDCLI